MAIDPKSGKIYLVTADMIVNDLLRPPISGIAIALNPILSGCCFWTASERNEDTLLRAMFDVGDFPPNTSPGVMAPVINGLPRKVT